MRAILPLSLPTLRLYSPHQDPPTNPHAPAARTPPRATLSGLHPHREAPSVLRLHPCPDDRDDDRDDDPDDLRDPLDELMAADPDLAARLEAGCDDAWEEAGRRLAELDPWAYRERRPTSPCHHHPGTWRKVLDLQVRLAAREPLFQAHDPREDDRVGFLAGADLEPDGWNIEGHDGGSRFRDAAVQLGRGEDGRPVLQALAEVRPARRGRMRTAQELARASTPEFKAAEAERKRAARKRRRGRRAA
jgi:hypothetical protein